MLGLLRLRLRQLPLLTSEISPSPLASAFHSQPSAAATRALTALCPAACDAPSVSG